MVRMGRLELPTPRSRSECADQAAPHPDTAPLAGLEPAVTRLTVERLTSLATGDQLLPQDSNPGFRNQTPASCQLDERASSGYERNRTSTPKRELYRLLGTPHYPTHPQRKEEESNPCRLRDPRLSRPLPSHPGFTFHAEPVAGFEPATSHLQGGRSTS